MDGTAGARPDQAVARTPLGGMLSFPDPGVTVDGAAPGAPADGGPADGPEQRDAACLAERSRRGLRGGAAEVGSRLLRGLAVQPWRPVLLSFLTARVIVAGALWVASVLPGHQRWTAALMDWDAGWYYGIAHAGYTGLPVESVRFFPLLPLLIRGLSVVLLGHTALAQFVLVNGCAVLYALLAYRLAIREGLSPREAGRVPWVIALAPAGFVLVMGYTEAVFGVLVCIVLLSMRSRRWMVTAVAGALVGALRPTGVILGLPILMEGLRGLRHCSWPERAARVVAVVSPLAGLVGYLAWVGYRFGDPWLPVTIQKYDTLRAGVVVNPLPSLVAAVQALFGDGPGPVSPLVHLATGLLALALLVGCARRLPPSFTALAGATVFLALTSRGIQSIERYAASAVPLLLVAAVWLCTQRRLRVAEATAAVLLAAASLLAFLHLYVP